MIEGQVPFQWRLLARQQKIYLAAGALLILIIVASIVWDSWQAHSEVWKYEADAAEAARQKDDALAKVAKVVSAIAVREEELSKVEGKKDVKADEVKRARTDVSSARAVHDHAVVSRRANVPSTEQLCRELADAGHPCQPR